MSTSNERDQLLPSSDTKIPTSPINTLRQYNSITSTASFDLDADLLIRNNDRNPTTTPRIIRRISAILASTGERTRRWGTQLQYDSTIDLEAQYQSCSEEQQQQRVYQRVYDYLLPNDLSTNLQTKLQSIYSLLLIHKYDLVLKCSLAYLIASLAVYNPYFSKLIGHSDSKHVVATVAVYFHPSRTIGSMHQSLIFVTVAIIFSFTISLVATGISSHFHHLGHKTISGVVNLVIASLAQALISYFKQFMNHATFNVACSLASMAMISAIIKEGSQTRDVVPWERLWSLFKIVCCGCGISVGICYLILPSSAEMKLKKCLNSCCSGMSEYLTLIETSFLNGGDVNSDERLMKLNKSLKKQMSSLNTLLEETKYELFVVGKEQQYRGLMKLVRSAQFLGSQLGGLRLSADMQWTILKEYQQSQFDSTGSTISSRSSIRTIDSDHEDQHPDLPPLIGINKNNLSQSFTSLNSSQFNNLAPALNSSQLFDLFIQYLGPSLKSLCYTVKTVLDDVPFIEGNNTGSNKDTYHYKNSLKLAGDLFDVKYAKSLKRLYSQQIFTTYNNSSSKIDEEEIAAACGNFASQLSEYSKLLQGFLGCLDVYSSLLENDVRSWEWIKFWKKSKSQNLGKRMDSFGATTRSDSDLLSSGPGLDFALRKLNTTLQYRTSDVSGQSSGKTLGYKLWEISSFFRKVETQFSIRVSLGFFMLASLAYIPVSKRIFSEWRGEWALVTYSIVMNKSLGGTTMTVNWRFIGTLMGCLSAYFLWTISDGNVYVLSLSGWVISLFSFDIILNWEQNNAFGRFILLTYNLTALYSFNITATSDDIEGDTDLIITDIATHRFISVMAGVLWAVFMTISFLPITARHRLKRGLAILWLRLGIIWNSDPLSHKDMILTGLAGQRGINHIMRELEILLKQSPKETRLKGPFRSDIYTKLINSTQTIIDAYQNINSMIAIDPNLTANELIVLNITSQEREELQNRIFLIFYMISSSITLGIPLPSKPASTEHAKDRIMVQLAEIRSKSDQAQFKLAPEDYVLLYSYVLVSNVVTKELDLVIGLLGDLYGIVNEETLEI